MIAVTGMAGCEEYHQDTYREYYVVESYLIAHDRLPTVRLSTTASIDSTYNMGREYVTDADVEIRLLRSDSTVAETYSFMGAGEYRPLNDSVRVRPGRLYQLHVETADGHTINSFTQVPGDLETVNDLKESYVFEGGEQVTVTTTPSKYPGRQAYYIFGVNSQDPRERNLTPFFESLVKEEDRHIGIYRKNSYGIFNESSYQQNEDGTVTLEVPWLAIAFYGPNEIILNAIDDNMYDFMRTQNAQSSGSESILSGKLRNIEYNIDGGIGIFGSMASDTNRVEILRSGVNS